MSSCGSNINKNFYELQFVSHDFSKINKYFVLQFFNKAINSKCTPKKTRDLQFILDNIVQWLRLLKKK